MTTCHVERLFLCFRARKHCFISTTCHLVATKTKKESIISLFYFSKTKKGFTVRG